MVNLDVEYLKDIDISDIEVFTKDILEYAINELKFPYEFQINVLITGNEEIKEINKEQRKIDKITDVLSFPMNDMKNGLYRDEELCVDYDTGEVVLGDIVINYEKVIQQASEYAHEIKREYGFLLVHSILHLFGYDHIEVEDENNMFAIQEDILNGYGLKR